MPIDDLGYDAEPVEGNPFGTMAASPNDYEVQGVDHDPFLAPSLPPRRPYTPTPSNLPSRMEDPAGGGSIDDFLRATHPEAYAPPQPLPDYLPKNVQDYIRNTPSFREDQPQRTSGLSGDITGGEAPYAPNPQIEDLRRLFHERITRNAPSSADRALNAEQFRDLMKLPGFSGFTGGQDIWRGGRAGFQDGGVTDLGEVDPGAGAPVPDAPKPMTSADIKAQGGIGTIAPADLPPSERLQHGLETAAESYGQPRGLGTLASTIANYAPVSGQVLAGADAYHYGSEGDYGQAALSGVGAVPDVGKFVAPIAHAAAPTIAHSVAPIGAMFLGTAARNVDRDALAAAKAGLQQGDHPFDVWNRHLWGQDPEGNWHTEIADPEHPPQYSQWGKPGDLYKLSEVYEHPELYENYPELADMPVRFLGKEHMGGALGGYDPELKAFVLNADMPPYEAYPTLAHESQHAIQHIEGWPGGTNPEIQDVTKMGSPAQKALLHILGQKDMRGLSRDEKIQRAKEWAYGTSAGEVQAFNTGEGRFGLPMDVRRQFHPDEMEHAPRSMQWWGEPGRWRWGQDILPRAAGGSVAESDALRRRLEMMMQPRHGFAGGGVTDLGSADDVDLGHDDPLAESGVGAPLPEAEPQPDLTEAARAGKLGTISSYTPSWSEQIKYGTGEGLKAAGASRTFAEDVGQNLSDIAGYTPGVGNVLSGNEAYRSYESGHPYLAALHAAAAIPIPGVKGATKAVENVAENVAEKAAVPSAVRVAKQLRRSRGAQPEEVSVFAPEGLPETGAGIGPAPPSALGGWAKAGDPEVVWNPERRGWDLTGRKIEKGFEPTTLFDRPEPMDVPPVPQSTLPRYEPPRGVPQRTLDITSDPAVREQHLALIRRGMDMGALAWYNAEPIRQQFLKELGDNEGQAAFQNLMDMVASTSPQQKVPENVRAASYYYWLNQNKLPVPERGNVPKIAYGGGQPVESPYGGLSLWQMNVNRVMNEGGLNPLENPKPPSFSQNLQGNWAPATVDMHAVLAPAILARHPDWLTKEGKTLLNSGTSLEKLAENPKYWDSAPGQNEYPTLERYYQSLAEELGITPAQAQAASWVGAGHITGLGSDGNKIFNNFFEDRIANTAAKTGKSPQSVLSDFIRGRHPLLSVAPLGALPFVASSRQKRTQDTDRPLED